MANAPKEFGPRSPEALAKLKTAKVTAPEMKTLSVLVPNSKGFKSGEQERIETVVPKEDPKDLTLYGVESKDNGYVSRNLREKKAFKEFPPLWSWHNGRGVYTAGIDRADSVSKYRLYFDVADGFGGVVDGSFVEVSRHSSGLTVLLGPGPEFDIDKTPEFTFPLQLREVLVPIRLFSSRNGDAIGYAGSQQFERNDGGDPVFTGTRLWLSRGIFFDVERKPVWVALMATLGDDDAWGLPKRAFKALRIKTTRARLKKKLPDEPLTPEEFTFNPPRLPGAGPSNVYIGELQGLGNGVVGAVVTRLPWAKKSMGPYNPEEYDIFLGVEQSKDIFSYPPAQVAFKNSRPTVFIATTDDYGGTWSYKRLTIFDSMVPVTQGFAADDEYPEDVVDEQPLLGYATYWAQPWGDLPNVGPASDYDLLWCMPDVAGFWDARCIPRAVSVVDMSCLFALSASIWMMFIVMVDDRYYNRSMSQYVRFRCLAIRTTNGGTTWSEVVTPISTLSTLVPTEPDQGWHLSPVVLRDGCALVSSYRSRNRPGDTSVQNAREQTLQFIRTTNYGRNWEVVEPEGLPSLDPKKIGQPLVIYAGADRSTIAVTAWYSDDDGGKYAVYLSRDDGATWRRGPLIKKGAHVSMEDQSRYDYHNVDRDGGYLRDLVPLLDKRGRPAVVNAGAPWQNDASKQPPVG